MTAKVKIISILQHSPIKQYKDQQYFPNLALTNPSSKIIKLAIRTKSTWSFSLKYENFLDTPNDSINKNKTTKISPTPQKTTQQLLSKSNPLVKKPINNPTALEFSPKKWKKIRKTKSFLKCFSQQQSLNSNKFFQNFFKNFQIFLIFLQYF